MKTTRLPDHPAEAERLLERLFRAGAKHYYIADRLEKLPELKAILKAPPEVAAEVLLRLTCLIATTVTASRAKLRGVLEAKARELLPGLKTWSGPDADWLGSGAERVPAALARLLLRRNVVCSDATFARLLEDVCAIKRPNDLLIFGEVVDAFVGQTIRRIREDGVGEHSGKFATRLATRLAGIGNREVSKLATRGRKQAAALRAALETGG